ncbi:hypothetical protein [Chitinophaga nivalis]|uniref:Uncharacterized protein n=1 Tax=Chitinophaga nivalis TaxID=2991709 RepID=A0ABT3IJK9_9BACT|nr:hypothetical protein [Chitinophaga nivalis]MCW3466370.1 hypothetical protein [Chitinophaga nivalis]MCW3483939.1 hypothetical protein [Chitinophaga nivalis]
MKKQKPIGIILERNALRKVIGGLNQMAADCNAQGRCIPDWFPNTCTAYGESCKCQPVAVMFFYKCKFMG